MAVRANTMMTIYPTNDLLFLSLHENILSIDFHPIGMLSSIFKLRYLDKDSRGLDKAGSNSRTCI